MLWNKLCVLVLLSDNVFGFWNTNKITTLPPIQTPEERITTKRIVELTSEPIVETTTTEGETTTEVTNNTEETTITEEPSTSTVSPVVCNTSLHTKEDLLLILNYFEDRLQIQNNIKNSFYSEALNIRDEHLGEIENFQRSFKEKPMHLKHILEHIRDTRQRLLPYVEDISESLKQYPELKDRLQKNYDNLVPVLKMFEKQLLICQLTCDQDVFVEREMILTEDIPYDQKEFYCGSIAEVHEVIKSNLSSFSENQQKVFQNRLELDNVKYANEIEKVKQKLKDIALKEFGRTMYDILELQDAYFHFAKAIKKEEVGAILAEVKYYIVQMKPKKLELEVAVQKLSKYCKSCSNNFESRQSGPTQDDTSDKPSSDQNMDSNRNIDLLDEVINAELQILEKGVEDIYNSIFENLVAAIEEANSTTTYIDDIRSIQNDVATETKQEVNELIKLKNMISLDYYQGLKNLSTLSKDILEQIDTHLSYINKIINQ